MDNVALALEISLHPRPSIWQQHWSVHDRGDSAIADIGAGSARSASCLGRGADAECHIELWAHALLGKMGPGRPTPNGSFEKYRGLASP